MLSHDMVNRMSKSLRARSQEEKPFLENPRGNDFTQGHAHFSISLLKVD